MTHIFIIQILRIFNYKCARYFSLGVSDLCINESKYASDLMFDYELIKVFNMYMDFVGKLSASIPKWLELIFLLIVYVSHCAALIHISIY